MNDSTPPVEPPTEAQNDDLSLATRILCLQEEHRALDGEITELYEYPYRDQLYLQRLKKKKLRIKDTIALLKDELIPDLNA